MFVPAITGTILPAAMPDAIGSAAALNIATNIEPESVARWRQIFPGLMQTKIGSLIHAWYASDYSASAVDYYRQQAGNAAAKKLDPDSVERISYPLYIHALRSIHRDFPGVPLVLVFQANNWNAGNPMWPTAYAEFRRKAKQDLLGTADVFDFEVYMQNYFSTHSGAVKREILPSMHLGNAGQQILGLYVAAIARQFVGAVMLTF